MKIVLNKCFGGFGLSPKAIKRYWEIDDYDGVETVHEVHRSW